MATQAEVQLTETSDEVFDLIALRPSIDETLMAIAALWARRSTCLRGAVGCVIADFDGVVISSGYNGAPAHQPHCAAVGCLIEDGHCVRAVHAEVNAITAAARRGAALEGSQAILTVRPCLRCTYLLIRSGVRRIAYCLDAGSENETALEVRRVCQRAGVVLEQLAYVGMVEVPDRQQAKGEAA